MHVWKQRSRNAVFALAFASGTIDPAAAFVPEGAGSPLDRKVFVRPELVLTSSHVPLAAVLDSLPNRAAWQAFQAACTAAGQEVPEAFLDPRSGAVTNLLGAFPLIPGDGAGNRLILADLRSQLGRAGAAGDRGEDGVTAALVAEATLRFARQHQDLLGIDLAQLGAARAVQVTPHLWQVSIPQVYQGVPVRDGRFLATISHGNLVVAGAETWGTVRGLSPLPRRSADDALKLGFEHAGGRSALDRLVRPPTLEIVPVAPPELQRGEAFAGPVGTGYRHRLVWTFVFRRAPDLASYEVMVDAHGGEVIAFQDVNHYATAAITGGVYPVTSTEVCPTPGTCGTLQSDWPMPFADTGLAAPDDFANSAGLFRWSGGATATTLTGRYVGIEDVCGPTSSGATTGSITLGGANGQHDCTAAGGSAGNTAASRTAYYEVNKIAEQARGWLPGNSWLQSRLTTNVNLNDTCNAYWSPGAGTINFYRAGGGCRNTGEIAGVFDHEWGHGLDDNDANGVLSNPSEAYADIAAIYRLQSSCVGHGFFWTVNHGCGPTADGTGFNVNEAQTGAAHCALDCSGVRDADWDRHADHTPDTPLGFVCNSCLSNPGTGPCGRQVHCAAAPSRQAAWDFVARDLRSAPFNLDSQTAFLVANKIFYQGSGNIGAWHACTCGSSSSGCGAANAYMQWLAADDDNGTLGDGTPHMGALYNAFNRHGIACSTPTPRNGGCSAGPAGPVTLGGTAGDKQAALSWTAAAGATRYWVFRSEGHAGCDFGKALIGETTGTTFTDTQVANGRTYFYNVVPAGSSSACFGRASNCVPVEPNCVPQVPVMTGATTPSGVVTASGSYSTGLEAWKAFDGSDTTLWISSSFVNPTWIAYEWPASRFVTKYSLTFTNGSLTSRAPKDWVLQGWNGSSWTTLDTRAGEVNWAGWETRTYTVASPGSYTKVRLSFSDDNDARAGVVVISLGRISFETCSCASSLDQVPVMTSDTLPSGVVGTSGIHSASFPAWKAFDAGDTTLWISETFETPAWIDYTWSTGRFIDRYLLTFTNGSLTSRAPKDWRLQGWNGSTWVTLDTRTNQVGWAGTESREFTVANPGRYTRYRLEFTDDNDATPGVVVISLGRIAFQGCLR